MNLFEELKRRNVLRVALVYIVVAWLSVQVADIMFESFGTPEWVMKTFIGFLALGFPIAVVFAWAFEMTPEGIKLEKDVDRSKSITPETGKKLNYWIIGAMAVAIVYLAVDNYIVDDSVSVPEQMADAGGSRYSIAVLPFVDMSKEGDNEYFSDGLSEELLNVLAQIRDFRVAGRTSSFAFKGKEEDLRVIGEKLDVGTILEGSVRKVGNDVRITAQLVNVDDGYHLWSATYDRTLDNIFEVQGEIATAVVGALKQTLLGEEDLAVLDRKPTENVEAYNHYLRGRFYVRDRTREQMARAQEEFQLAVTLDPDFALAYSGLSDAYMLQATYGHRNYEDVEPLAQAAVDRAMAIDDQISEVWASQGGIYWFAPTSDDDTKARAALKRAVELNPNNTQAWMWLGGAASLAQLRQGLSEELKAYELDPLHPIIFGQLVRSYLLLGEHDQARHFAQELIDLDPDFWRGYSSMAFVSFMEGRPDEVVRWALKGLERDEENLGLLSVIGDTLEDLGDLEGSEVYTRRALALNPDNATLNADLAYLYFLDGRREEGLALLEGLLEEAPENTVLLRNVAYMEFIGGNENRARELFQKVMTPDEGTEEWRITDSNYYVAAWYAFILNNAGDTAEAERLTDAVIDWTAEIKAGGAKPFWLDLARGMAYAARGDRPEAVAAMRAAADTGWAGWLWIDHDPVFNTLRDDLGYVALMDDLRAKRQTMRESLQAEGI